MGAGSIGHGTCHGGELMAAETVGWLRKNLTIETIDGVLLHGHAGTVSRFTEALADLTHSA
jgi:hypothetical protein